MVQKNNHQEDLWASDHGMSAERLAMLAMNEMRGAHGAG